MACGLHYTPKRAEHGYLGEWPRGADRSPLTSGELRGRDVGRRASHARIAGRGIRCKSSVWLMGKPMMEIPQWLDGADQNARQHEFSSLFALVEIS